MQSEILPDGLNTARILQWPNWRVFSDAILCDNNLVETAPGRLVPRGVALNPLGRMNRRPGFDEQLVLRAMQSCMASGRSLDGVGQGRVVPIHVANQVWGACWFLIDDAVDARALFVRYFLPIFLLSSALLSLVTFVALRRFVLDPVADLARASARIAEGDFSARATSRAAGDEIGGLVHSFNHMTAQVEGFSARLEREVALATSQARAAESAAMTQRRLAAMGELAAGIAHEINNPLGGLINAAESLREGSLKPEKQREYFGLLRQGLERIQATVGQLLRLAPRMAHSGPVSLVACAVDAAALVRYRASRQGVALEFRVADVCGDPATPGEALARELARVPAVRGDSAELAQALLNLFFNALDALESRARPDGSPPARIEVEFRTSDSFLEVLVVDNGPGVPPEMLGRIADLFFTTKDPGKGTGLGLALVHRAVAGAGGSMRLESPASGGFRAVLRFPLQGPRSISPSPGERLDA